MELSVDDISHIIGASVSGDRARIITGVSSFDDAGASDITFAGDKTYLSRLHETGAGAVIVPEAFDPGQAAPGHLVLMTSENPKLAFFELVNRFHPVQTPEPRISPRAVIGQDCTVGDNVLIEANVVIRDNVVIGDGAVIMANVYVGEGCRIGPGCHIKPNVTLMEKTRLGMGVIVHSGTVIGSDGYGFVQDGGTHTKLSHTGYVEIGDQAEIGACNTIDRGTLGITRIGSGVKTDNQVHIAHNVKIGDNSLIVAQVGIAGSTHIGKNVILAGKAGISGHLTIGDNVIVGPYAGVSGNVPDGEVVSGIPHQPHRHWLKVANTIGRLPGMRKALLSLEKRMKQLERQHRSKHDSPDSHH